MSEWLDNALYSTVSEEYQEEVSNLSNGSATPDKAMQKIQSKAKEAQTLVQSGSSSKS